MADTIYVGQALLFLSLETNLNILAGTDPKIMYEKPSGTVGDWTGTVPSGTPTQIQVDISASDLDESGVWKFQASIVVGGQIGYGEVVEKTVRPILS